MINYNDSNNEKQVVRNIALRIDEKMNRNQKRGNRNRIGDQ